MSKESYILSMRWIKFPTHCFSLFIPWNDLCFVFKIGFHTTSISMYFMFTFIKKNRERSRFIKYWDKCVKKFQFSYQSWYIFDIYKKHLDIYSSFTIPWLILYASYSLVTITIKTRTTTLGAAIASCSHLSNSQYAFNNQYIKWIFIIFHYDTAIASQEIFLQFVLSLYLLLASLLRKNKREMCRFSA